MLEFILFPRHYYIQFINCYLTRLFTFCPTMPVSPTRPPNAAPSPIGPRAVPNGGGEWEEGGSASHQVVPTQFTTDSHI